MMYAAKMIKLSLLNMKRTMMFDNKQTRDKRMSVVIYKIPAIFIFVYHTYHEQHAFLVQLLFDPVLQLFYQVPIYNKMN